MSYYLTTTSHIAVIMDPHNDEYAEEHNDNEGQDTGKFRINTKEI